ncbi:MAG: glycoside hydrolase family 15 protein [Microbacterium gubbeenense]
MRRTWQPGRVTTPIDDYALLADLHSAALVSRGGSIDWMCLPRFDSAAVFTSLLGTPEHGRWLIAPEGGTVIDRQYEDGTFVLRTRWRTPTGEAEVTEFMPAGDGRADLVREVTCVAGTVEIRSELILRPDYGATIPWAHRVGDALTAIAGPDQYVLRGPSLEAGDKRHVGRHELGAGETATWVLTWSNSWADLPVPLDIVGALDDTRRIWRTWDDAVVVDRRWAAAVRRSLLVLRALTHADTGGIVAAPTTSLPEDPGGERNWDYRYCWLRDSALTLESLLAHGGADAAANWRDWLLRAIAGDPDDLQIMYGVGGERSLAEHTLDHLPGYLDSAPVRVGNGAVKQYQADVVGEVMIALAKLREAGVHEDDFSWPLQRAMLTYTIARMDEKDQGLWEMRGEPHYFTHSRVMMWAAFDRGVRAIDGHGLDGPREEWARFRDQLRAEILEHGVDPSTGAFRQTYGQSEVDASLLQIAQSGFVAYDDPLMLSTVEKIEHDLLRDGLVLRYRTASGKDGLAGSEHPFVACSFWLVEQYAMSGREADATALMDRLVGFTNDLGLLAEEYDASTNAQIGNFPQAFSHLALVRAADALTGRYQAPVTSTRSR